MSTYTIHPENKAQEKALKTIFDAFKIKYERELDETEYLMASKANELSLDKSIKQAKNGEVTIIALEDLWK